MDRVKLTKRYWRFLRHKGVKPTQRNKWICGNRVLLHQKILPDGNALTWGNEDTEYYETIKWWLCHSVLGHLREHPQLFCRAVAAAVDKDFDK